jgi:hypothetical protein
VLKRSIRRGEETVAVALAAARGEALDWPQYLRQVLPPSSQSEFRINPQYDRMAFLRCVKLIDGKGRSITRTLERHLNALGYVSEKQRQHARQVAHALQVWCSSRDLPSLVEAISRRSARAFISDLSKDGLARRTIENYRTVLSRLWEQLGRMDADYVRNSKFRPTYENSTPLENPWMGLAVPQPRATRPSSKVAVNKPVATNTRGLARGPAATTRNAVNRAYRLRLTLTDLSRKGITSNCGIAKALNDMGEKTPRGGRWDATGVRRLKVRCRWRGVE